MSPSPAAPPPFDPPAAVQSALARIRAEQGVAIPLAIESGSRAWGFPSPDSDWDARFLFVRPVAQHLTPWPARDVIELPISGDLDVNGWDLGKALTLLLKGNAVVVEWLTSPLVYSVDPVFRDELLAFARRWLRRDAVARHYLHLGRRIDQEFLAGREAVKLKKLFYALRPAAALRWLRLHPGAAVAPMSFLTLMDEIDAAHAFAQAVDALIAEKANTREMGEAPAPPALLAFIAAEFEAAEGWETAGGEGVSVEARAEAEALYRRWVWALDR